MQAKIGLFGGCLFLMFLTGGLAGQQRGGPTLPAAQGARPRALDEARREAQNQVRRVAPNTDRAPI